MVHYLTGTLQAMSDREIASMVDQDWLTRIKAAGDSTPLIKAFTIAHEGDSNVQLDGIPTPIKWVRTAIEWIGDALSLHTPIFNSHGSPGDNSLAGRTPIGEVVGKKLMKIKDKVATVAAMYIYPQFRNLLLDVASIETDIGFRQEGSIVLPTGVAPITGIALGDSKVTQPGFPGATLIGAFQAFADLHTGAITMTLEEIKALIADQKVKPLDIFTLTDLVVVPEITDHIRKEKHDVYHLSKRVEKEAEELKDELARMNEKHEGEVRVLKSSNLTAKATVILGDIAKERNLDDKEMKFAELNLKNFKSEKIEEEQFKGDLNVFVDDVLEKFSEVKTILGVETTDGNKDTDKDKTKPGQPTSSAKPSSGDDYRPAAEHENPDENPYIPGGKADLDYDKKT